MSYSLNLSDACYQNIRNDNRDSGRWHTPRMLTSRTYQNDLANAGPILARFWYFHMSDKFCAKIDEQITIYRKGLSNMQQNNEVLLRMRVFN